MGAGLLRNGREGVGSCRVGAPRGGAAEHGGTRGAVATKGAGNPRGQRATERRRPLWSAVVVGCCPRLLSVIVSADVFHGYSLVIVGCGVFVRFN